jgi:hypothetical protein
MYGDASRDLSHDREGAVSVPRMFPRNPRFRDSVAGGMPVW